MLSKRQYVLAVALLLTIIATFFAPAKQDNEVVEAKKAHPTRMVDSASETEPLARYDNYKLIEKRLWVTGKDTNLFPAKPKPLPPPALTAPQMQLPPPKPSAPPLPFTYIGKVVEDGKLTVFVAKQLQNYLLKGGEVIEGTYKVDKVEMGRVVFTYLPIETEQVMIFGGKD